VTRVLFVAWDGPHQSYLESLFLPIHEALRAHGHEVHVMQLRYGSRDAVASARAAARSRGVPYVHVPVLERPRSLGVLAGIAAGAAAVRRYVRAHAIDAVMPRSMIPAAIALSSRAGVPLVFDADGFSPDERVDFAGWSATGATYRLFRDVEAQAVRRAVAVITRTARAKEVLIARAGAGCDPDRIHVIPNGTDEARFHPGDEASRRATRDALGVGPDAPLLVYAGSLGPQYYPRQMMELFERVRARDGTARLVVLTGQPEIAREAARAAGVDPSAIIVRRVPADEVPGYLAAADLGLALREATFSQRGVSPIKVGEYLLCGLPVLATTGVGDLDAQLAGDDLGRLLDDPRAADLDEVAAWLLNEVRPRRNEIRNACRARGVDELGLERCVARYARALACVDRAAAAT